MTDTSTIKIPLPTFLKTLTSNNVPVPRAMAVAAKIYKEFNTPSTLAQLTDLKLKGSGVSDKEDRKLVIAALKKAGYIGKTGRREERAGNCPADASSGSDVTAGPSSLTTVQVLTTPSKRKRKQNDDVNEFLPDGPVDEAAKYGSLDFNEVIDEEVLKTKSTVVNRAPLMTAWAAIVAERMGFEKEEALSIASVYTEMNAISKGVSLGIFEKGKEKGLEASRGGAQPFVEIMGRRIPLYQTQSGQWRALSSSAPAHPSTAFGYISRALRQTTPHIIGALRLLAESYGVQEVNAKGFGLYAEFRPDVEGWGGRGEVSCLKILGLRKKGGSTQHSTAESVVKFKNIAEDRVNSVGSGDERQTKKARGMSLEEYEAALDQDSTFDDIDV